MSNLEVPRRVAHCPYCWSNLVAEVREWEDGGRVVSVTVFCDADMEAFQQDLLADEPTGYDEASHPCGYDPDWMDACERAENWARTQRVEVPA